MDERTGGHTDVRTYGRMDGHNRQTSYSIILLDVNENSLLTLIQSGIIGGWGFLGHFIILMLKKREKANLAGTALEYVICDLGMA